MSRDPTRLSATPSGTRDFLPGEMRELKAMMAAFRERCDGHGYSEVHTPAIEYERALAPGHLAETKPAYRLIDASGEALVLRSDMTLPVGRLVAQHYCAADYPLRIYYVTHIYRSVKSQQGQRRELLHCGAELFGLSQPASTIEVLTVLTEVLAALGLTNCRIFVGDVGVYEELLNMGVIPTAAQQALVDAFTRGDFPALERCVAALDLPADHKQALVEIPRTRGDASVLQRATVPNSPAMRRLRAIDALLPPQVREVVSYDLGQQRSLGYHTGPVFQALNESTLSQVALGGHYDLLLEELGGDPGPAVGFALDLELAHRALAALSAA